MKDLKDLFIAMSIRQKQNKKIDDRNPARFHLDPSIQGVKRLFVCDFNNTDKDGKKVERDSYRKYFLLRVNISNYNVLIDCRNFHDQPINDQIKKNYERTKPKKYNKSKQINENYNRLMKFSKNNKNFR